jgi:hypothetical protein
MAFTGPIGRFTLADPTYSTPQNPRGWIPALYPGFDVASPTAVTEWLTRTKAYLSSQVIPVLVAAGMTGVIVHDGWNGQQYAHPVSYDGAPDYYPSEVPQSSVRNVVAWLKAQVPGLRVGTIIRPTEYDPNAGTQTYGADPVETVRRKIAAGVADAMDLFYCDSFTKPSFVLFTAAEVQGWVDAFPGVELFCEWYNPDWAGIPGVRALHLSATLGGSSSSGHGGYLPGLGGEDVTERPEWDANAIYFPGGNDDPVADAAYFSAAFRRGATLYLEAADLSQRDWSVAFANLWRSNYSGGDDFETLVYRRLWQLLESHGPLVDPASTTFVAPGNRIKWDQPTLVAQRKGAKAAADYREIEIRLGDFTDSLYTAAQRYAFTPAFDPRGSQGWTQVEELGFQIILTHNDARVGRNNPFEREVRKAITLGGPRLGLSWVHKSGPMTGTREPGPKDSAGNRRFRTTLRMPVTVVFDGRSQLV